jgi:acyl-CoA thioester hydrolase
MRPVSRIRVLYADTDQMGVVNNGNYLRWFEIGRAEWLRGQGRSYREIERAGYQMPVVEAHLRYREPARYDDLIDIETGTDDLRAASVKFKYAIRRHPEGLLLCEGYTIHACLDGEGRVRRFPDELLAMLRPGVQRDD